MAEEKENQESAVDFSANKLVWIAGAIILLIAGYFGLRAIFASMESFRVTLVDAPKEVNSNTVATFTWRIDGPSTTINQTTVRLGTASQTGELGKDVKPENTSYNLAVQDFINGNFNIPLQFVGNIALTDPGVYYYRVYGLIKDKHYWSDEYSLEVKVPEYKVVLLDAPPEAVEDEVFSFTWRVEGLATTINHTSVHYGTKSTAGDLVKTVKPDDTDYTDLVKDFAAGNFNIPLQFVGNTTIAKPGTYYYRGHAIINGEHYWTEEKTLTVKSAKEADVESTPVKVPAEATEEPSPEPTVAE